MASIHGVLKKCVALTVLSTTALVSTTAAEATPESGNGGAQADPDLESRIESLDKSQLSARTLRGANRNQHRGAIASAGRSLRAAGVRVADDELVVQAIDGATTIISTPGSEPTEFFIGYGPEDAPLLVEIDGDVAATASVAVPTGPGSANWVQNNSGTQVIIWSGRGEALNFWYIDKVNSDGTTLRDYWGLRRKVAVQPYAISGLDWSITGIFAGSYPTTTFSSKITGWEDFDPSNDLNGSCNTTTQAVDTPVGGLGISFTDCDQHDMTFRAGTPGWYTMFFKQGAIFSGGNRSTGYAIAVRTINGATGIGWNLETRLEFARYTYPAQKCTKWGSSGTVYC